MSGDQSGSTVRVRARRRWVNFGGGSWAQSNDSGLKKKMGNTWERVRFRGTEGVQR